MRSEEAQQNVSRSKCLCRHCGTPVPLVEEGESFCCAGCRAVYEFLQDSHLENFYLLRSEEDHTRASPPKGKSLASFGYLDDKNFLMDYVRSLDDETNEVSFYIEGVHCSACIWLLERLPQVNSEVVSSRLNYSTSQLIVQYQIGGKLSAIAQAIASLGYTPRVVREEEFEREYRKESLQLLYRLGVAAVSAGNCMMIAVSLYEGAFSGIEQRYAYFFGVLSACIALPAVMYSASPFYRAAFNGLRSGKAQVDLPLSIGIAGGYLFSVLSLFFGSQELYFDSITLLIFLMLSARIIQRAALKHVSDMRGRLKGFLPQVAHRLVNGKEEDVYIESLQPGDTLVLRHEEIVPADSQLVSSQATIDKSVLTGESRPVMVGVGDVLYGGCKNLGESIEIEVEKPPRESRIHSYFNSSRRENSSFKGTYVELIAKWFVVLVLAIAGVCFLYWYRASGVFSATEITLSFLIVTCPCALGLATPLILARAVVEGISRGIFVSKSESFEGAMSAREIFVDKTGTLTDVSTMGFDTFRYIDGRWMPKEQLADDERVALLSLERGIHHPLAEAFRRAFEQGHEPFALEQREKERCGISGVMSSGERLMIGSKVYLLAHAPEHSQAIGSFPGEGSTVFFAWKSALIGFVFHEVLEQDAKTFVHWCRKRQKMVSLLSGDDIAAVQKIGYELQISPERVHGDMSPEEKACSIMSVSSNTMMVGDGANDAAAFVAADISIGVRGGAEQLLSVADVYIQSGRLIEVLGFLRASEKTVRTLRVTYVFALCYNLIAGIAAVCGIVSPLLAAILMPISSFTVVGIALFSRPFRGRDSANSWI